MKRLATVAVLALLMATSVQANLLINGDLDLGNTGQLNNGGSADGWFSWGNTSGWHASDPAFCKGVKSIKFWWDANGLGQTLDLTAGETYTFSAEAISPGAETLRGWNGILQIEWKDDSGALIQKDVVGTFNGAVIEKPADGGALIDAGDGTDQWVTIGSSAAAPAGTTKGTVVVGIRQAHAWAYQTGGALYFDNISVVPEPATLSLLAFGGLALLRRKK